MYPLLTCLAGTFATANIAFRRRFANANAICMGHSTPGGAVSSITGRVPSPVLQPKRASCCAPGLQIFGCVSLSCTDISMVFFFLRDGVHRHGLLCHGSLSFALIEICPKRAQNRFFAFMIGSRSVRFRAVTLRCQTGDYIFLRELTDEYGWKSRMNCMT